MQNYLSIDITDYENSTPLIYFTGQKGAQFQRYVCVYQDIGRGPQGTNWFLLLQPRFQDVKIYEGEKSLSMFDCV
jgi:hypothetical protein